LYTDHCTPLGDLKACAGRMSGPAGKTVISLQLSALYLVRYLELLVTQEMVEKVECDLDRGKPLLTLTYLAPIFATAIRLMA